MRPIKVYSHPRSGTHFLMASLYKNFFEGSIELGVNRRSNSDKSPVIVPWDGLFGGHGIMYKDNDAILPKIYMYRDGRDVIVSMYNNMMFHKPRLERIENLYDFFLAAPEEHGKRKIETPFSEFLRRPLGWEHHPNNGVKRSKNPVLHWLYNTNAWNERFSDRIDILFISYEQLNIEFSDTMELIKDYFKLKRLSSIWKRPNLCGWGPYKGKVGLWKDYFSPEDLRFYRSYVPLGYWASFGDAELFKEKEALQ